MPHVLGVGPNPQQITPYGWSPERFVAALLTMGVIDYLLLLGQCLLFGRHVLDYTYSKK